MRKPQKHVAVITAVSAHCECGRMPGVLRKANESQGAFTVRANDCFRIHREAAMELEAGPQIEMFAQQEGLFA